MVEESPNSIPCRDCNYFDGKAWCTFPEIPIPTTPKTVCQIKLYDKKPLCTPDQQCISCGYLGKGCFGDKENPAQRLEINPHWGQKRVFESRAQHIAALWGSQCGKTELGPHWMYQEMLERGNGDYMVVSSAYPLMDRKLIPVYLSYFCDYLGIASRKKDYKDAKKKLNITGGGLDCTIFFGSAKNANSLEAATAKAAHLDEVGQDDFTLASYDAVLRRVSSHNGRILYTTTLYNFAWLKTQVYDRWVQGDPDYEVIQCDSIVRPGYSKTVWEDRKRKMPDWKFKMQYRGLFERPAGVIYSDFDETIHLIKMPAIPMKWNWHVGIDPGAVHTALVWVAEEPATNKYYIVHSYLDESKITTKEHVKKAMKFSEYSRVVRWVGGAKTNEEQFRLDWTAEGIHVRQPEISDVESQIDRIITLLKEKRLFIVDNDENTVSTDDEMSLVDEFRSYSRELDENGKPTDRIKDDKKFHKLAACRYVFAGTGAISDYSTPVVWQENHIPSFEVTDILRNDEVPQF